MMQGTERGIRETVDELFDQYILDALHSVEPMIKLGQVFAYIGIAIMALRILIDKHRRANLFKYLSWVPLAILLLNYKVIVISIYNFYEGIGIALKANDIDWDVLQMKILLAQIKAISDIGGSYNLLSIDAAALEALAISAMTSTITAISAIVSTVVFIGIKAMSVVYLFILIVFGPLNIGLSFIPALAGMWKAWLQKFMSVCLWIPMLYLIDNFLLHIMDKLINSLLSGSEVNLGLVLTSSLLMLMNIFIYLKAPVLANLVVQGMNVSATHLKDQTKHYSKKAVQTYADAKTGGATKGIRTLVQ